MEFKDGGIIKKGDINENWWERDKKILRCPLNEGLCTAECPFFIKRDKEVETYCRNFVMIFKIEE